MNSTERRREIISKLLVRRNMTAQQLADELNVTTRTIMRDIQALSYGFPIFSKAGWKGGIYLSDAYMPYCNTLTKKELSALEEAYEISSEKNKPLILQVIMKYGPYNYSV